MKAHIIMKIGPDYPEHGSNEPVKVFVDLDKAALFCADANNSNEMTVWGAYVYQIVTFEIE